jgi:DNA-binding PadR family transcriptional regulator
MTAPHMISHLKTKYEIHLSPGTLYPTFRKLENTEDIVKVPSRKITTYRITNKGLKKVSRFRSNLVDLEDTFHRMLGENYWAVANEFRYFPMKE